MSQTSSYPHATDFPSRAARPLRTPRSRYWKDFIKLCWTSLGAQLPDAVLERAHVWLDYLYAARWFKKNNLSPRVRVQGGREVFRIVAEPIAQKPVVYLEFGVYKGHGLRQWSVLLKNPESQLVGFDSFIGLPEEWHGLPKGSLTVNGVIPQIPDPRVSFVKGWFQDTLPRQELVEREVLVVFLDADLYSSTIFVLRALRDRMKIGKTVLIFGQFTDRNHELRAFDEFRTETGMEFETIAADYNLYYPAFKRVG